MSKMKNKKSCFEIFFNSLFYSLTKVLKIYSNLVATSFSFCVKGMYKNFKDLSQKHVGNKKREKENIMKTENDSCVFTQF